ncbi:MAG TPA: sigma-70 family RNA polymerase sigma factor [Croceibacterium sp.]|nr:sigma-70 family RNA polymerase sigma factor [Croceibacterium sp.]
MAPETSDQDLMLRAARGDIFAYTALVQRHVASVFRTGYRFLHDRIEAEDIAQECFARLWQMAPGWQSSGSGVPAWLQRVCTNLCLDRLRRKARWRVEELPELVDSSLGADRLLEQGQMKDILERCLGDLAGNHRAAIVLTYYEGLPNKAAAELMSMDIKAFESLLYRARQKLGALLALADVVPADLELLA